MGLGNQGKGSRFSDRKEGQGEGKKDLNAGSGRSTDLELKMQGFQIDKDTRERLLNYVHHMKTVEGDSTVNNSSVARKALDAYLEKEGF